MRPKPCAGRSLTRHGAELDQIYHDLVRLRHGMARKLGFATYTPLGYRRMRRVDYGPDDVARYREQVVTHVVPLVARLLEQRRAAFGWDKLRFWDEALIDPAGNPKPAGGHDFLVTQRAHDVRWNGRPTGRLFPRDGRPAVSSICATGRASRAAGSARRSRPSACRSFSPTSPARIMTSAYSRMKWVMRFRTIAPAICRMSTICGRRWNRPRSTP